MKSSTSYCTMGPLHSAHPFALTSDPKPTIVLVPDAWFPTTAYAHFLSYLREREFPVEAINHPSLAAMLPSQATAASGSPPNSASSEIDAMSLLQHLLRPLIEREHRDVVLLMHCYGGIPGMGAARGLSKVQRWQQGLAGGIVGMIAVSPLILRTSATLQSAGIPLMQWAQRDVVSSDPVTTNSPHPAIIYRLSDLNGDSLAKDTVSRTTHSRCWQTTATRMPPNITSVTCDPWPHVPWNPPNRPRPSTSTNSKAV